MLKVIETLSIDDEACCRLAEEKFAKLAPEDCRNQWLKCDRCTAGCLATAMLSGSLVRAFALHLHPCLLLLPSSLTG